jgi:hypothetical protein
VFRKGKEIVHSFYKHLWRMQKWKRAIMEVPIKCWRIKRKKLTCELGLKSTPVLGCVVFFNSFLWN